MPREDHKLYCGRAMSLHVFKKQSNSPCLHDVGTRRQRKHSLTNSFCVVPPRNGSVFRADSQSQSQEVPLVYKYNHGPTATREQMEIGIIGSRRSMSYKMLLPSRAMSRCHAERAYLR